MIFDSQEQKDFVIEVIKKHHCTYEQAVAISAKFMNDITAGKVVPKSEHEDSDNRYKTGEESWVKWALSKFSAVFTGANNRRGFGDG